MNIGIIGCGGFVQGNHLPNAAANPHLRIRALCDLNESILADLKESYSVDYVTTDYSEMAKDPEIEMVVLGTSPHVRVEPIRLMAENGKHIYVEKPMSLGDEDSKEIIDIIKATGVKLQVGFNRPYCRIMRETKRLFQEIKKGETLISYRIIGESQLWPQFHRDKLAAGDSTIIHELTHIFDLMNWIIESYPATIYTIGGRSDNNIVTLTYPDETAVTIMSGGCGTEGYPKERMEIHSDHKVIVMNDFVELGCAQINGEGDQRFPLKSSPGRGQNVSYIEHGQALKEWRRQLTPEEIMSGYYYGTRPSVYKGHYDALDFLRQCIVEDRPTEINEYHGAVATIMGLNALESLATGLPVQMDSTCLGSVVDDPDKGFATTAVTGA